MKDLAFVKMQGLGNDFVVFDRREGGEGLSPQVVQRVADRRFGVGCDQVLILEPSAEAHAFMRIFNPDGSEAEACGNGTRCVARLLMDQANARAVAIETVAGVLEVEVGATGYTVDMGVPRSGWREIPLGREADTDALPLVKGPLANPVAVNMGNPHAVFFVADLTTVPLHELGPGLEHDGWFPERANIEVVQVLDRHRLRVRVWERGAGITLACGSGACAALVAAVRRGLAERTADVMLDGGTLRISWNEEGRVLMTGPAGVSFRGELAPELVEALPA
jgi:diaminopimelate epimerase